MNGVRGSIVSALFQETQQQTASSPGVTAGGHRAARSASEVGGVSAKQVEYVIVDFPAHTPEMVPGRPLGCNSARPVSRASPAVSAHAVV